VGQAVGYEIKEVRGDVRIAGQVVLQLPRDIDLKSLAAISTEVAPNAAAGILGSRVPERLDEMGAKLEFIYNAMRESDQRGERATGIESGGAQMSRVDLLLKRAVVLRVQAEQMVFEHSQKNRNRIDPATGGTDIARLVIGFDNQAHQAKLREAHAALKEARDLDPANTEVLLNLAELLVDFTKDDPTDEQQLLHEVQRLLNNPRSDVDMFRLAQSKFLLAMSHVPLSQDVLRDARELFSQLRRTDWVRHCDRLLKPEQEAPGHHEPVPPARDDRAQTDDRRGNARKPRKKPPADGGDAPDLWVEPTQFNPAGRWHVQVVDAVGSTMELDLAPDGTFNATQTVPRHGASVQATGQWAYNPVNRFLQLNGLVGGFQPFAFGIMMHMNEGPVWYGSGTDGMAYLMAPASLWPALMDN
jgi:hypothetical protein